MKKLIKYILVITVAASVVLLTGIPSRLQVQETLVLNVRDFGAIPDDQGFDEQAFQATHDSIPSGRTAVIFVPRGEYIFNDSLNISKDNTSLVGEGTASIIKRAAHRYINLVQIPNVEAAKKVENFPQNIAVRKLTFDGNDVFANDFKRTGSFANIWVWQGKNVELSDLLLKNNEYMGISVSNGYRPSENVTIRNIRGNYFSWCLLHLGNVRKALVDGIFAFESPTQKYYPVSHTGIDIEVEGSRVPEDKPSEGIAEDIVVKNSLFILPENRTATGGISVSPAYGPVNNVRIENNFFKNYNGQIGVQGYPLTENGALSSLVKGISILNNWTKSDASNHTWHSPMGEYSTVGFKMTGNVINDESGFHFGPYARGGNNIEFSNNVLQTNLVGPDPCLFRIEANQNFPQDYAKNVSVANNRYYVFSNVVDPQKVCREYVDPGTQNVTVSGNELFTEGIDLNAPQIAIETALQSPILEPLRITVKAEDTGNVQTGIARVVFLVDGIPQQFLDQPPYSFDFDPAKHGAGQHTVGAISWDNRANISPEITVPVVIGDSVASNPLDPALSGNFCGIKQVPSPATNCAEGSPRVLVKGKKGGRKYFVSESCKKRPLVKESIKKSYCGGKLPEMLIEPAIIKSFKNDQFVTDIKGKKLYRINANSRALKKVKGSTAGASRLSRQEFKLYSTD